MVSRYREAGRELFRPRFRRVPGLGRCVCDQRSPLFPDVSRFTTATLPAVFRREDLTGCTSWLKVDEWPAVSWDPSAETRKRIGLRACGHS